MKNVGLEKARRRLREASKHADRLEDLSQGINVPAFEYEWFLALSAINSAHEILRTSAFKDPTSRQWFSSIEKHTIRKDPLLRYLLHARGVDHHGVTAGTAPEVTGTEYLGYTEDLAISFEFTREDGSSGTMGGGAIILADDVSSFGFAFKLVPVIDDRDGTSYAPPQEHLGQPLVEDGPVHILRLGIAFYGGLADEASVIK